MKISNSDLVSFTKDAFHKASNNQSKLSPFELNIEGMSGNKGRHLLNNLCSIPQTRYLEVGMWRGSTLCSAIKGNSVIATGIDNWSEFGGPMGDCKNNVEKCKGSSQVKIIDQDCFTVDKSSLDGPYNVYFYDGGHSEIEQYKAITYFDEVMADSFVLVVDDWMQLEVVRGTLFGLKDMKYDILWENHCRSVDFNRDDWWCGLYLAVVSKHKG